MASVIKAVVAPGDGDGGGGGGGSVNHAPVISSNGGGATGTISLAENTTAVTTVTATDIDAFTTLTYSISGGADAARFAINSATGALTFIAAPDFEAPTDVGANNVYDVIVRASDGTLTDDQALAVTVTNVNEAPVITSNGGGAIATISVNENTNAITTVTAIDDPGTFLTYSIVGGIDRNLFTINAAGVLSFISTPDFENPLDVAGLGNYKVSVQVSDGTFTDRQDITVKVANVNEAPLIGSNGGGATAAITIAENTTTVTKVTASDPDSGTTLVYSIAGGADAAKFAVDAATGALSFIAAPNFETPTDAGANNVYDVIVRASDGTLVDDQALAVTVSNVAEAPVIISNGGGTSAAISVAENASAVTTVLAADQDLGGLPVYSIVGGADAARFAINQVTGALSFIVAPNFEAPGDVGANNVYDLIVRASDGTLFDDQSLAVTVTNVNEAPVIGSNGGGASAAIAIAENTTAVTKVTASDGDSGTTLVYSIAGGADAAKFAIDAATGALSFKAAPDYDVAGDFSANNVYDVIVRASDGKLVDDQAIAVTVTNVNEPPVITTNGGGATAAITVNENTKAVTTVTATDPEGAGTIVYSIAGGADAARFQIDPDTGKLTFATTPNFEAPTDSGFNNVYDVIVRASDGTLTDDQAIAVTVANGNEPPSISTNGGGDTAAISIAENTTAVTKVTASDVDAGTTITYSITGGADAARFAINAATGALSFVAAPNFEGPTDAGANNVYDVIVRASDGALVDDQTLAVTVTNVAEAPVIGSNSGGPSAAITIAENTTAVTKVIASDSDTGTTLVYSIAGGADAAKFAIDAATGALSFKTAPDFDIAGDAGANNVYDVIVRASDGALVDDQALAVTVTNLAEAPVIGSNGGGATAAISVAENTASVTTVNATDSDTGTTITYSITGGADAAKFSINPATGALSFISAPNFEAPTDAGANNVYDVIVRASDGALVDDQALAVTVTNVNEFAPVIGSNGGGETAEIVIPEGTLSDLTPRKITIVAATDLDAGTTLTYSIVGGADASKFIIYPGAGVLPDGVIIPAGSLFFTSPPDFDNPRDAGADNTYDVVVQVSDGTKSDTQQIAVKVANVNEPPEVALSSATPTIPENAKQAVIFDTKDPEGGALTYSVVGPDAALFEVVQVDLGDLGKHMAVQFLTAPNFEKPQDAGSDNVYNVTLRVSDGTNSVDKPLTITVTNINEAPVIPATTNFADVTQFTATENSTVVAKVAATDDDLGTTISYSIVGGADAAKFAINASTGALTFKAAPDFEAPNDLSGGLDSQSGNNIYGLVIRASDGALFDDQPVFVEVANANEAPVISSNGGNAAAAITIAENGTAVTKVTAGDVDAGTTLAYSIVGGADAAKFAINAATGALSFIAAPNFDIAGDAGANNVYDVIVRASDGALFDDQTLAVTVTNVAEAPVIGSNGGGASAAVTVAENATAVTKVTASDPDAGTTLAYSIAGGADAAKFSIDAATGALSFKAAPNFEAPGDAGANNVYDVIVRASDGTLVDNQAIAVTVANANDAPVISSNGGNAAAAITIAENGTAVTKVIAGDVDAGTTLAYSIAGGADAAKFAINAATGALSFVAAPNFEAPTDAGANNVYDVIVRASDGALFDDQTLAVTVTNVNEFAPVISSNGGGASATIMLAENFVAVTKVTASDQDLETRITYSINGGADAAKFTINPVTGALAFAKPVDFEVPGDAGANNVYDVIVRTSDGTFFDDQAIAVSLTDVLDTYAGTSGADMFTVPLGSLFNWTISGLDGNDILEGGGRNDAIDGGSGDDSLRGGQGTNRLIGRAGSDTVSYSDAIVGVKVDLGITTIQDTGWSKDQLSGVENLIGSRYADKLTGDAGANTLSGGDGDDSLSGGDGNDTLIGGGGANLFDGGAGIDTVSYEAVTRGVVAELVTLKPGDVLFGKQDSFYQVENLIGSAFADALKGDGNANVLTGGDGNDVLSGAGGNDTLIGGAGADKLDGGDGVDTASYVDARAGVTINLTIGLQADTGAGADTLSSVENLIGSRFADTLTGDDGANSLSGGDGNDVISGAGGLDIIDGGAGDDKLDGGGAAAGAPLDGGVDYVSYASAAAGVTVDLRLTTAQDTIGAGKDTLSSFEGIIGSDFADTLTSSATGSILQGGNGNDTLNGGSGGDLLRGGGGNDVLVGGAGVDLLYGGAGADVLTGGKGGPDRFYFTEFPTGDTDTITDFEHGSDRIGFDSLVFSRLISSQPGMPTKGALAANQFVVGTFATTLDQHLIFDTNSRVLYYDPDGSLPQSKIAIATLLGSDIPSASDFVLI